jgi:CRP-like cAMP-binding protein
MDEMTSRRSAPLDSAMAIARTPLFASLTRVDLAKLAAELKEIEFPAGELVIREGDPGDAFYIIKDGKAGVFKGELPRDARVPIVLARDDGFGEMALVADSPRTASVIALSDLTVWRLSRERFDRLLATERSIAQEIERTLAIRLADKNREAEELRQVGQALSDFALSALSAEACRLLRRLAVLGRWQPETLRCVCDRVGDSAALAELERQGVFLVRNGEEIAVRQFGSPADG